jgi:hypothetical protein
MPKGSPAPQTPGVLPPKNPNVFHPAVADEELTPGIEKKAFRVYRFQHREPPEAGQIQIAQSVDAALTVDRFSRSVGISGTVEGVELVTRYLEAIDVVPGSCAVQSWAVYVDKSAQKGFDLVAALLAVSAGETTATLGEGGLTLNLNVDRVSVALDAIADGSAVEVVQRPHVQLQHGVTAKIESLQEVPIPSTAVSQGIAQTSVEYRKVGLQLEVVPYFLGNDQLRLGVMQNNGLIGQNVRIGENEVPVIQSQMVSSSVQMTVGQTVVLGGVATYRERLVRGLLRNVKEVSEGSLYVIISTYHDVPKAVPVDLPQMSGPDVPPPLIPPFDDPADWINGELLPAKGWRREERDFLRAKSAK